MAKRKRGPAHAAAERDPSAIDPAASKLKFNSYEDLADSEDDFHLNRDKVALAGSRDAKRPRREADEALELSDEEVLGYSDSASDEEESESGDNEQASDDLAHASDNSQSEGEREEEDDDITNWGSSKADYYNADAIETEQDALDEEAEARRIQQKRLRALEEADFGFDENAWIGEGKDEEWKGHGGVVTEVLPPLQVSDEMSPAERLKLLKARYPEFEPLAKEMVELQPLHTSLAEEAKLQETIENEQRQNVSIVSLKYNALSGYLGALAMYFAILTSTATDDDSKPLPLAPNELREHEIMDALVRCRDLWASVKDLRQRSIDEFSTSSPSISDSAAAQDELQIESEPEELSTDPKETQPTASQARREARLRRTEESLATLTSTINAHHRRRATKPTPTTALQSQPAQPPNEAADLDSDIGDEPSLTPVEAAAGPARRKKSLKFYTSQLAQKASKRANAGRGAGGDEDVPHRERLRDRQERLNREAERRAHKEDPGAELGDEDSVVEETNAEREARAGGGSDGEGEMDEAARALEGRVRAKKAAKLLRSRDGAQGAQRERPLVQQIAEADGRRDIGYAIEKNKGLTPRRKKEVRNPRVKKRMRFEDKKKKLRSMKATYKGGEGRGGYGGELTGIKKGLVRSVKL